MRDCQTVAVVVLFKDGLYICTIKSRGLLGQYTIPTAIQGGIAKTQVRRILQGNGSRRTAAVYINESRGLLGQYTIPGTATRVIIAGKWESKSSKPKDTGHVERLLKRSGVPGERQR